MKKRANIISTLPTKKLRRLVRVTSRSASISTKEAGLKEGKCTICRNPSMHQINAQLILQSGSLRDLSLRYGVGVMSLHRHRRNCLPELHAAMRTSLAIVEGKSILKQMRELHVRCMQVLARAEQTDQLDTALRAVREARGNLELLAKLDGTLAPQSNASGPVSISVMYVDRPQVGTRADAHVAGDQRNRVIEASAELEDLDH